MKQSRGSRRGKELVAIARADSVVWITLLACAFALLLSSASAARTSGAVGITPNGIALTSSIRTAIYNRSGKFLCTVFRRTGWWAVEHSYGELWIEANRGRLEAHFTHNLDGWARPTAPGRWNVVAAVNDGGPYRFYGRIIRRPSNRWSFSNTRGHVLGYTVGPDGPAAGTAALIFLWHDSTGC